MTQKGPGIAQLTVFGGCSWEPRSQVISRAFARSGARNWRCAVAVFRLELPEQGQSCDYNGLYYPDYYPAYRCF